MILYRNQLLYQTNKNRPLVYLGYDRKVDNKIWAVVIEKGKAIVDWFYTSSLDYVRGDTKDPATPEGKTIMYGKYKTADINTYHDVDPSEQDIVRYGEYLKTLSEKYNATKDKK